MSAQTATAAWDTDRAKNLWRRVFQGISVDRPNITVSGFSSATLNMGIGSSLTGSVTTGTETGASRLYFYGTNVSTDVTVDSVSAVIKLGETLP